MLSRQIHSVEVAQGFWYKSRCSGVIVSNMGGPVGWNKSACDVHRAGLRVHQLRAAPDREEICGLLEELTHGSHYAY